MASLAGVLPRICEVAQIDFKCKEVEELEGARIGAQANCQEQLIKVTTAIVAELDEDELAYVLCHEISHLRHGDTDRLKEFSQSVVDRVDTVMKAAIDEGGGFLRIFGRLVLIGAVGAASVPVALLMKCKLQELEADYEALSLMTEAGFDPQGAISALNKFDASELSLHTFIETHPPRELRIACMEAWIDEHDDN